MSAVHVANTSGQPFCGALALRLDWPQRSHPEPRPAVLLGDRVMRTELPSGTNLVDGQRRVLRFQDAAGATWLRC